MLFRYSKILKSEKGEVLDTLTQAQLMSAMKKMAVSVCVWSPVQ